MHFSEILIDNRIICNFIDKEGAENIIFCRPIEENLKTLAAYGIKKIIYVEPYKFDESYSPESIANDIVTGKQIGRAHV